MRLIEMPTNHCNYRHTLGVLIAAMMMAAPAIANASKPAFVWAGRPKHASYTPAAEYTYNPSGGSTTINRKSAGVYTVVFGGLRNVAGGGTVQVAAYGAGPEHCKVVRWTPTGNDLTIEVRCFLGASSADAAFTALFMPHPGGRRTSAPPPPPPVRRAVGPARGVGDTPFAGNTRGGRLFTDACPPQHAIIGVRAHVAGSIEGVHVLCGRLSVGADGQSITVSPAQPTPLRGRARGQVQEKRCPANEVAVGFDGRSGSLIDKLRLNCAPLRADNSGTLRPGRGRYAGAVGKSGGRPFAPRGCPQNGVATVAKIRAGNSVDAFGMGCGRFDLQ